jgi:hypothetical protein
MTTLYLLGFLSPIDRSKIPALEHIKWKKGGRFQNRGICISVELLLIRQLKSNSVEEYLREESNYIEGVALAADKGVACV